MSSFNSIAKVASFSDKGSLRPITCPLTSGGLTTVKLERGEFAGGSTLAVVNLSVTYIIDTVGDRIIKVARDSVFDF